VADSSAAAPAAEAKTEVAAAGGASAPRDPNFNPQGEYDKLCATCHAIGLMNAPKLGDSAAWKERLDKAGGLDGLVQQGIKGINAMPPKGGSTVNDDQFHDLVVFFLDKSDVAH
ncbi:MAG: c-type cytochrome, partial [Cardiobacterium hominis]